MKKVFLIIGIISLGLSIFFGGLYFLKGNIEIKLNGGDEIDATVNEEFHDSGLDVLRNGEKLDNNRYSYTEENNVDVTKIGDYKEKYVVKYLWLRYHLERTVHVVDNIMPDITVSVKEIEKDYCTKKVKTKYEYKSMDNYDGDLTDKVEITEEDDNVIFSSIDNAGNENRFKVPIIYTKKPNPIFRINGSSNIYVTLNSKYSDSGATYEDGCGNKINDSIKTSGAVDTSKLGDYTITYTLSDGQKLTRTVTVYNPANIKNNTSTKEKVIYLTFDDGPGQYTQKVLNTLDKYSVKATFFVTHQFGSYVPLIKKEYEGGHSVAVHSYTHNWNVYKSVDAYVADFNKMNADVEKYTGSRTKLFRFPGGSSNTISRNYAKGVVKAIASRMTNDGYVYFDWDVDSGDAAGASRSKIYSNVVNGAARCKQCVILMHDIKPNTINELDNILKTLTSKGYKFGTLNTTSPTAHQKIVN